MKRKRNFGRVSISPVVLMRVGRGAGVLGRGRAITTGFTNSMVKQDERIELRGNCGTSGQSQQACLFAIPVIIRPASIRRTYG